MGIETVDDALIAGARAENEDFKTAAAISPLKIAKRPIYLPVDFGAAVLGGSAALDTAGTAASILFLNASSGNATFTVLAPRYETSPGEIVKLHLYVSPVGASSGNSRWVSDVTPMVDGFVSYESAIQRIILMKHDGTTNIHKETLNFSSGIFGKSHIIGLKITRDPTASLDTYADNCHLFGVVFEMQGRC